MEFVADLLQLGGPSRRHGAAGTRPLATLRALPVALRAPVRRRWRELSQRFELPSGPEIVIDNSVPSSESSLSLPYLNGLPVLLSVVPAGLLLCPPPREVNSLPLLLAPWGAISSHGKRHLSLGGREGILLQTRPEVQAGLLAQAQERTQKISWGWG